jgi:hypothetical protein
MSKFRIVEQRGVFRIRERDVKTKKVKASWSFGSKVKDRTVVKWTFIVDFMAKPVQVFCPLSGSYPKWGAAEFDTYKKAENYIKKFYGSTGVDAIEKPEWTTV